MTPRPGDRLIPQVVIGEPVIRARGLDWRSAHTEGGHVVAALGAGTAVLTREPAVEQSLQRFLDDNARAPYAATVLMEPATGRVIAVAESSTRGDKSGLAFRPIARAASVFKVVTTSALLEAGVSADAEVCIHGGKTRMQPALLVDDGRKDHKCTSLEDALSHSQNVAIAKLALKHLEPAVLRSEARKWGFDAPLPMDVPLSQASPTSIPDDPFGFANAAAGFGDVKLSALHGAVLASIVANGGVMVPPQLVDAVRAGADSDVHGGMPELAKPVRVVDASVARALGKMMRDTVAEGTGRKAFSASPRLQVMAAGKTGSLTDYQTGLETTWFIGYAPADHPEIAVATVVVNTSKWNVRAPLAAKEALRAYFAIHPATHGTDVVARR